MADPLNLRLRALIDETLQLDDVDVSTLDDSAPLIGSGLSLDSIDALELVVKIEKEFGTKTSSSEESRQAPASTNSLAEFIRARADAALRELNAGAPSQETGHPVAHAVTRGPRL